MFDVVCKECGKTYKVPKYRLPLTKHCSKVCHSRAIGKISSKAWAHKISKTRMGMKCPWNTERNKKYPLPGPKTFFWKGDDVGYIAIHNWAHRHVKLKDACEKCSGTTSLEMSNKSQEYKRELSDWWTLCKKCHTEYDWNFRRKGGVTRKRYIWQKPATLAG